MPYIQTGSPQRKTNNPGIADVYHSGNVYINNVAVALWLTPGGSDSFAGVDADFAVELPAELQSTVDDSTTAYLAAQSNPATNSTGTNNPLYNAEAAAGGVKGNYNPCPGDGVSTSTSTVSLVSLTTSSVSVVAFLQKTVEEAAKGMWRETGQGGNASNPNITGIWKSLGYPSTGGWTSDQTAWCMGFVNFALKSSGCKYVQTAWAADITTKPALWNAVEVPKDQAQPGDVAFWSYRHVNFVYENKGGKFSFVGGNQSPKASNNPNDGDVTISWPGGIAPNNPSWVSCWRITKP